MQKLRVNEPKRIQRSLNKSKGAEPQQAEKSLNDPK